MTWNLVLDVPDSLWMTANRDYGRGGYKKTLVDGVKVVTTAAVRKQRPGLLPDPCLFVWEIHYPKGTTRKADPENSMPTCKVIQDQLVNLGLIADDSSDHIITRTWRRGTNLTERGRHMICLLAIDQKVEF